MIRILLSTVATLALIGTAHATPKSESNANAAAVAGAAAVSGSAAIAASGAQANGNGGSGSASTGDTKSYAIGLVNPPAMAVGQFQESYSASVGVAALGQSYIGERGQLMFVADLLAKAGRVDDAITVACRLPAVRGIGPCASVAPVAFGIPESEPLPAAFEPVFNGYGNKD